MRAHWLSPLTGNKPLADTRQPTRRPWLTAVGVLAAMAATVTACSPTDATPTTRQTQASPVISESDNTMATSPATHATPITIDIAGETVTGTLSDNAAARSLIAQLPLTLTFTDYGGHEKIADLPAPLLLEGMPAGDDADPLTIGHYAPDQALVLYYEHVGYFDGITRIGTFEGIATIRDHGSDFTARLNLAN